jgi:hypothetical protein
MRKAAVSSLSLLYKTEKRNHLSIKAGNETESVKLLVQEYTGAVYIIYTDPRHECLRPKVM